MERVLPDPEVKERIADLAVGLASNCDAPEGDVEKLMREHLKGASTLPFVAFVTHDGRWVGGFSGYRDVAAFRKALDDAEGSPLIQASEAVRKKLAGLGQKAAKAAEAGDWKGVVAAAREAGKTTGRCSERKALAALRAKAKAWASARLDEAAKAARGGDSAAAQAAIAEVRLQYAGEPEAAEADAGAKAVRKLSLLPAGEAGARAREKAAEEFRGTRWEAIFLPPEVPAEAPADPPSTEPGAAGEGRG